MNIYLHDVCETHNPGAIGAHRANIDTVESIDAMLVKYAPAVELSIDDGYSSNIKVLPLLEKHNVHCTLFITTGFLLGEYYPYELELSHFLEEHALVWDNDGMEHRIESMSEKENFFKALHIKLKNLDSASRNESVEQFFHANSAIRTDYRKTAYLDADDLRQMAKHPLIDIGSHSHSHLVLPAQSSRVIAHELYRSRKILEEVVGHRVSKLSYPYGANNRRARAIARMLGYAQAFATGSTDQPFKRMALPRTSIRDLIARG